MDRPLSGIRILDLTNFLAGPYATMILGDLGAEVIKVESPQGDPTRKVGPRTQSGECAYYLSINRNKKSVVLNLKSNSGKEALHDLCRLSHVLMESFRPGVAARLRIDYTTVEPLNPKLIYCSTTGFGQTGPYSDLPAYDMVVQALSGGMSLTGEVDGLPVRAGLPIGDIGGGVFSAIAVLAALNETNRTGRGQHLDVAMFDTQISMLTYQAVSYLISGIVPHRQGREHLFIPTYRTFRTKDNLDIVVTANTEDMWRSLCQVLGLAKLTADPRFITNDDRLQNKTELGSLLEEAFRNDTADNWLQKLKVAGVPAAPIKGVDSALADTQSLGRNMVVRVPDALGGNLQLLGNPIKMSRTPCEQFESPPTLGQHTVEVLRDVLKYSKEQIERIAYEQCTVL